MDFVSDFSTANAITLAFFSIFFFYYLYYRSSKASNTKEAHIVQGAWPIIGHLPLPRASNGVAYRILGELATKYGPLFTIKLGTKRVLVLSNWEMAKECFTKLDLEVSNRSKLEATQHMAYNGAIRCMREELKQLVQLSHMDNMFVTKESYGNEPVDMTEVAGITYTKENPLEVLDKPCLSSNCYDIV